MLDLRSPVALVELLASQPLAATSPDGLAAWQAVVSEFRRTLDDPLAGWPVLAGIALGVGVVWVNVRLARALLASFDAHHAGPDPVDHHA